MREIIERILKEVLVGKEVELVEVVLNTSYKRPLIRVFLDKQGGISVKECSEVARDLSVHFQVEDDIPEDIQIEVSSPGVDRPIKTVREFERNVGRNLDVRYLSHDRELAVTGKLSMVEGDRISLSLKKGELWIALSDIVLAKQHLKF